MEYLVRFIGCLCKAAFESLNLNLSTCVGSFPRIGQRVSKVSFAVCDEATVSWSNSKLILHLTRMLTTCTNIPTQKQRCMQTAEHLSRAYPLARVGI